MAEEARKRKVDAYLQAIEQINQAYQLRLIAVVSTSPNGIIPRLAIEDIIPPKPEIPQAPSKEDEEKIYGKVGTEETTEAKEDVDNQEASSE